MIKKVDAKTAVREAMKERKVTQRSLAEKLGVKQPIIARMLTTQKNMGSDYLVKSLAEMGYEVVVRDKISGRDVCVLEQSGEEE